MRGTGGGWLAVLLLLGSSVTLGCGQPTAPPRAAVTDVAATDVAACAPPHVGMRITLSGTLHVAIADRLDTQGRVLAAATAYFLGDDQDPQRQVWLLLQPDVSLPAGATAQPMTVSGVWHEVPGPGVEGTIVVNIKDMQIGVAKSLCRIPTAP